MFQVLAESSWLEAELASRLAEMARFRNLLVHGYAPVDDDRVVDILHSSLDDLTLFRATIGERLTGE